MSLKIIPKKPFKNLICFGDSLTASSGATNEKDEWPALLAYNAGMNYSNNGVGGETSTQIATRFLNQTDWSGNSTDSCIYIIWAGRNNYTATTTVKSDIAQMVSFLPAGSKFLVVSIINGEYSNEYFGNSNHTIMINLNSELEFTYGPKYTNLRSYLVSQYDPNTPQDVVDFARDIVPSTLRSDNIHLNNLGYSKCATWFLSKLQALGWV